MIEAPPASLGPLLRQAAARLAAAGLPEARREAGLLWSGVSGRAPGRAWLDAELPVTPPLATALERAVGRRVAGAPQAYAAGATGFRHLLLRVDARGLIPRPETEGLVDLLRARSGGGRMADVGTGSGCLALSLLQEGVAAEVIATDRSAAALGLATENASRLGLRPALVRTDLLAGLAEDSLDAAIANPPYLTEAEHAGLDPGVRDWEPAAALVSGPTGLEATERLLDQAVRCVRPGGWIAVEVDSRRAGDSARAAVAAGWAGPEIFHDLYGRPRYLLARRSE